MVPVRVLRPSGFLKQASHRSSSVTLRMIGQAAHISLIA